MRVWNYSLKIRFQKLRDTARREKKICDIGCEYGFFLRMCEENRWTTFGTDISNHAIAEAKKSLKAELQVHNIEKAPPFPSEKFDVITCFDVVEHLKDPQKAIENFYQNLNGGGILLISTPNIRSYSYRKILFNFRDRDASHISLKTPKQWENLLKRNGFRILSCETLIYNGRSKRLIAKIWFLVSKLLCLMGLGFKTEIVAVKK